jgi:hypothetical protein
VAAVTTGARSERSGVGGALERRWVTARCGCGWRSVADGAAGLRVGWVKGRSHVGRVRDRDDDDDDDAAPPPSAWGSRWLLAVIAVIEGCGCCW